MTQAKTIDQIEAPLFADVHINYIKELLSVYYQDKIAIDALDYDSTPTFSMLQLHMAGLDSQISVLKYIMEVMENTKVREEEERILGTKAARPRQPTTRTFQKDDGTFVELEMPSPAVNPISPI